MKVQHDLLRQIDRLIPFKYALASLRDTAGGISPSSRRLSLINVKIVKNQIRYSSDRIITLFIDETRKVWLNKTAQLKYPHPQMSQNDSKMSNISKYNR
jgi:hypothetical protein